MIEKILDEIDIDTVMYLINAITFEAQWERIYYDTEIYEGTFYNSDGSEAQREFMYSEENKYISLNGAEGFIKDYKEGKFSFAALLPPENMEIDEFIEGLEGDALLNAFKNYENEPVVVNMPKFSSEYEIELKEPLIDMGMVRAFDSGKAEFEKMCTSTRGNVYINRVVHKTFINVDEKGTTAGAVTMVEANDEGAILGKEVKLDRPFLYFIIDNETGMSYLIELKIGGDLDNKKARSEKEALLEQYCILTNRLGEDKVKILFATAYNRYGEGKPWTQGRVRQFFCEDELCISRDFWNLVCKSENGYDIVIDEYKKNAHFINEALDEIKDAYLPNT